MLCFITIQSILLISVVSLFSLSIQEDEPFTVMGDATKEGVDAIQDPVSLLKAILTEKEDHCLPVEVLCGVCRYSYLENF